VTVQPVIDLADHLHVNSYQATARLRLQTHAVVCIDLARLVWGTNPYAPT
jgi:hypothetical protein